MGELLQVSEMPPVPGLQVPSDLYIVTRHPALLAGMRCPSPAWWEPLHKAGFQHVVCLAANKPNYDPAPLVLALALDLEDLVSGEPPRDPPYEELLVRRASDAALHRLHRREGVVVHCVGGRGRSGTVLGGILRCLGFDAATVIEYLDAVHKARGKLGWPEATWQCELVGRYV